VIAGLAADATGYIYIRVSTATDQDMDHAIEEPGAGYLGRNIL
jgi:hypothetical protein